jgi:hypothetical protein
VGHVGRVLLDEAVDDLANQSHLLLDVQGHHAWQRPAIVLGQAGVAVSDVLDRHKVCRLVPNQLQVRLGLVNTEEKKERKKV